jgi:hypothetical protein
MRTACDRDSARYCCVHTLIRDWCFIGTAGRTSHVLLSRDPAGFPSVTWLCTESCGQRKDLKFDSTATNLCIPGLLNCSAFRPRGRRFEHRSGRMGFVVNKAARGKFSPSTSVSLASSFPPTQHHLSSAAGARHRTVARVPSGP